MNTIRVATLAVTLAMAFMALPAQAYMEPVILGLPKDCPSCFGSAYYLGISEQNSVYTVTLSIDTSGYTGSESYISAVGFKVATDVTNLSLSQTSINIDTSEWRTTELGINSGHGGGCQGSGVGFVCSDTQKETAAAIGGAYAWTWTFTLPKGVTLNLSDAHIGAQYGGGPGQITSESVPEPGTLLLLGTGLLGLGGLAWRRNRKGH